MLYGTLLDTGRVLSLAGGTFTSHLWREDGDLQGEASGPKAKALTPVALGWVSPGLT